MTYICLYVIKSDFTHVKHLQVCTVDTNGETEALSSNYVYIRDRQCTYILEQSMYINNVHIRMYIS